MSAPASSVTSMLTDREDEMLQLEAAWWKYAGAKEAHVREHFGVSSTRYYQQLNALIDRPEALAAHPMTVRRLRRLRVARREQRERIAATFTSGG
jgi:hypothetical protein